MDLTSWFLSADERGNPACRLAPWSAGNAVRPLVNGSIYFARLVDEVKARLPIWKRQVFTDGAEEWVNCP